MPKSIIVIADHAGGRVNPVTYELIALADRLQQAESPTVKVFILGAEVRDLAKEIADQSGLVVTALEIPEMRVYNGEIYRNVLSQDLADDLPAYVCVAHTSRGQDFAPALAAALNAACISGVENVQNSETGVCFSRPLYGGKVVACIRPVSASCVLTVQPGFFKPAGHTAENAGRVVIRTVPAAAQRSRPLGLKQTTPDPAGITEAAVIVAAGQGIGDRENLDIVHQLAALFSKSAVAGSRIVCDRGWLNYQCQVGVTGATVSPRLYIACGISGAIQHVSGMRGSEFIVAINRDPAAAIFQVADVCIVADLHTFIPTLIETYRNAEDKLQSNV
jgi:electron transfer flavoprotein alpha subunit